MDVQLSSVSLPCTAVDIYRRIAARTQPVYTLMKHTDSSPCSPKWLTWTAGLLGLGFAFSRFRASTKPVTKKPIANTATARPLAPLNPEEILSAVRILKSNQELSERVRFICVQTQEPDKQELMLWEPGKPWDRQAFMIVLDNKSTLAHEAVVSLTTGSLVSWTPVKGQCQITAEELFEVEQAVKESSEMKAALEARGLTDMDLVCVDPWSAGRYYNDDPADAGRRLSRALVWVRNEPGDNLYSHPVDGLTVMVDLNSMEVIRVDDLENIPVPQESQNYSQKYMHGGFRTDLKPICISQPDGPSFKVDGHFIEWQKWSLSISFNAREGLVIHEVGYNDAGTVRPILFRGSLGEMTVPYGDSSPTQARKNAFDVGEYGLGCMANSLTLGCDCLGHIKYFNGDLVDAKGGAWTIENAICLHEEDYGMLWKHTDWRTGEVEVRRSRRLAISFVATVGNYEYAFFWYFYMDGAIEYEVKLTGMLTTAALRPGEGTAHGTMLAPGLYAAHHQHVFGVRLDMNVDGGGNSVYEVEAETLPYHKDTNPYGNAWVPKLTLLKSEKHAARMCDSLKSRSWKVVNSTKTNRMGYPTGYKLMPGEHAMPLQLPESSVMKRGGYMAKQLWVTQYDAAQRFPAGEYPNQNEGGLDQPGLPEWIERDADLEDTDVVLWYSMAHTHIVRCEDWPVMPTAYIGFTLKPVNFFDMNPANDVPPVKKGSGCSKYA